MASPAPSATKPAALKLKPPKPPKLLLDKTYGPQPDLRTRFKSPSDFKKMYRAYQWLQGHDLCVADETPTSVRLSCATHPTCPFNVTALYTVFTDGPVAGKPGFFINPTDFVPEHDHPAPYIPMNQQVEDARRAKLAHDDPSLENPPLVRVQGFAGSDSEEPESESARAAPSGAGAGVGAAPAYGFASADDQSRATPSARGGSNQPPPPPPPPAHSHYTNPHQHQPPPLPAFGSSSAAPYSTYTGGTTTMLPQASTAATTMYPHDTVMRASSSAAASPAVPLAPHQQQQQQQQHQLAASSNSGYPNPNPTTMRTELQTFLVEIHPSFADYFPYFRHLIPLDTSIEDLLSLDEGLTATPEDHTVFNLFREIKELPLLLVAMAADGVRKAKIRKVENPEREGGWNPRIAEGLEKARAEKWVRDRIRDGQAVLAREAAAAAAAAV